MNHGYNAKILADSLAPNGHRLVTFEITFPRMVLAEFGRHRMFSFNAASSRAIPIGKMIRAVLDNPVIPEFGRNQKGMQAGGPLDGYEAEQARATWLLARDHAVNFAGHMDDFGTHKQVVNRLLEPWMWATVIVSATEWGNFFNQRCHVDAQPEIRKIAEKMARLYYSHQPTPLDRGEWHTPLIQPDESLELSDRIKVSVGRAARVSYLTHSGTRDIQADIDLHDRLLRSGHFSPFEHVATPARDSGLWANFRGFRQYRRQIPNENRRAFDPKQLEKL